MNKRLLFLSAALCLLLTGCASLLERSYSSIEPYTNRYWDSTAEDTLKAESYQDLVNSILMLVEQRSEEGIIRYYTTDGADGYAHAVQAKQEVYRDTALGAYLLNGVSVVCRANDDYCTLTYSMSYREGTQDLNAVMALTDSQSLTDLLRIAVREEHDTITARFISKTSRDEVLDVVDGLWQVFYQDEWERCNEPDLPTALPAPSVGDKTLPELPGDALPTSIEVSPAPATLSPPCPWNIRFYPDVDYPEVVEIVLKQTE